MAIEVFAPAKINLTLHVTGQRADGYHLLDSLVVFADIGDRLWLTPGAGLSPAITGPFADGVPDNSQNLVWRAAEIAGFTGAIRLEKNLPHGAGIGGGSADAAAVLRAMFGDDVQAAIGSDRAASMGADVPVCLHAGPQRMRGIGDELSRIWTVPACAVVLVNPGVAVPTSAVFAALHSKTNPPMSNVYADADFAGFVAWLSGQRNDLQTPACAVAPVIATVLDALSGAAFSAMSGSGSTCFGLYPSDADAVEAAQEIAAAHPDWWVKSARTIGAGPVS